MDAATKRHLIEVARLLAACPSEVPRDSDARYDLMHFRFLWDMPTKVDGDAVDEQPTRKMAGRGHAGGTSGLGRVRLPRTYRATCGEPGGD